MKISHSRPTIDKDDISAVTSILSGGLIATGHEVQRFEHDIAKYIGTAYSIATNSGTNALHLALLSLGIGPDDSIILPSYVCSSVLHAVNYTRATPILVDIENQGYNICAQDVADRITSNTKAVIVPHMFGTPANMESLLELGLPLIEDCAQAIGTEYKRTRVGNFGTLAIFSFKATKVLTTGHGGMVVTNNEDIFKRLKGLVIYDEQETYHTSYNYNMTDFQAALGRSQLAKLETFIRRRNQIQYTYDKVFENLGLSIRKVPGTLCFRYVMDVDDAAQYIQAMRNMGINCARPVFKPLHQYLGLSDGFPNTDRAIDKAVSIPVYPSLRDDELQYICDAIQKVWYKIKEQ